MSQNENDLRRAKIFAENALIKESGELDKQKDILLGIYQSSSSGLVIGKMTSPSLLKTEVIERMLDQLNCLSGVLKRSLNN